MSVASCRAPPNDPPSPHRRPARAHNHVKLAAHSRAQNFPERWPH